MSESLVTGKVPGVNQEVDGVIVGDVLAALD